MVKFLSVILPSYNVAQYIERAMNSLLSQNVDGYEIIIVDDGSTDNLLTVCGQWKDRKNVRVIHTENQGVSEARNAGLRKACGEYVYFMDPDDWIDENTLVDVLRVCQTYGGDAIRFGFRKIKANRIVEESDNDGGLMICDGSDVRSSLLPKYIGYSLEELSSFGDKDFGKEKELSFIWRFVFRRELLLSNNIRFQKGLSFMEDKLFICEVFCHVEKLLIYNKVCYNYCVRTDGLMKTNFSDAKRFAEQRILAENCRSELAAHYRKIHGIDVEPLFQGTLILASMQLLFHLMKSCKFSSLGYVKEFLWIPTVGRAYNCVVPSDLPWMVRFGFWLMKPFVK